MEKKRILLFFDLYSLSYLWFFYSKRKKIILVIDCIFFFYLTMSFLRARMLQSITKHSTWERRRLHSDRGTQYCCNEYIALLQDLGIRASMTQTGDPLHNALAERINNTVKNGWLFETQEKSFEEVKQLVQKAVDIYNRIRPHQSLILS